MPTISITGPLGVGKSTVGQLVAEALHMKFLSMGDILRNPDSYPGVRDIVRNYDVHSGALLSDQKLCAVLKIVLDHHPEGWVLDGVPRRPLQYTFLKTQVKTDLFVVLTANVDLLKARLAVRQETAPRADCTTDKLDYRFEQYEQETLPVIAEIKADGVPAVFIEVTAEMTPVQIAEKIIETYKEK